MGGDRGAEPGRKVTGGRREKSGRWESSGGMKRETTLIKTLKKNIINKNFNIIMLFDLYIESTYTNDSNVLAKIRL